MNVLTAAVVLSWGCLIILTLAMAGMLRQLRELQAEVAQLGAPQFGASRWGASAVRQIPALASDGPLLLLVLDPGCSACQTAHPPFTRLAADHPRIRFEVLSPSPNARWADSSRVRSRVDPRLVAELDLPWAPALLLADADGTVLNAQPVHSPSRLADQVTSLLGWLAAADSTGGSTAEAVARSVAPASSRSGAL